MRTTVAINDEILAAAKRRAAGAGLTLGQLVETALRRELARRPVAAAPPVPTFQGVGGAQPGVDLTSNRAMRVALDEGHDVITLR